jgi:hypothetical protein
MAELSTAPVEVTLRRKMARPERLELPTELMRERG